MSKIILKHIMNIGNHHINPALKVLTVNTTASKYITKPPT